MGLLTTFIPQRKTRTHYVMRECVRVFVSISHILFKVWSQNMVLCSHVKDIKRPVFDTIYLRSTGQSRAVHWPTTANEIGG